MIPHIVAILLVASTCSQPGRANETALPLENEVAGAYFSDYEDNKITKLIESRRYEKAISLLANEDTQHNNLSFCQAIYCHYLLKQYQSCSELCEKWLRANPSAPKKSISFVFTLLGFCEYFCGNDENAVRAFDKATENFDADDARTGKTILQRVAKETRKPLTNGKGPNILKERTIAAPDTKFSCFDVYRRLPIVEISIENPDEATKNAEKLENSGEFEKAFKSYQEAAKT